MSKIAVLVVDDSAVVRQVFTQLLTNVMGIELIGSASDPLFALKKMEKRWPDVIVLDLEMPRMDGLTFLKKIMAERPTPIIICSSLTEKGATVTMQALSAGAVDIICKPQVGLKGFLQDAKVQLIDAIKAAAQARLPGGKNKASSLNRPVNISTNKNNRLDNVSKKLNADAILSAPSLSNNASKQRAFEKTTDSIIALGTSTGGTQALEQLLTQLPVTVPGIVIVQHMPAQFTAAFAKRLNDICRLQVKEARSNDRVMPGHVYISPGGQHMLLKRSGAQYQIQLKDGPPVSRHKPSVDVLFRSVAQSAGPNALGVILTGMGDDGANGLKEMHNNGAKTLAQDEASCIVYGMPKEAVKRGGVDQSLSLQEITELIAKIKAMN